jgi:hypothetical protein
VRSVPWLLPGPEQRRLSRQGRERA